jgi:hypothetical protein
VGRRIRFLAKRDRGRIRCLNEALRSLLSERQREGVPDEARDAFTASFGCNKRSCVGDDRRPRQRRRRPGGSAGELGLDPSRLICAPPGQGLPPLPGTPGFAGNGSSHELLVFNSATGGFIGVQHLLRPDIYLNGTPPCPQQPNGAYIYIPRNETYSCFRAK